MGWTTTKVVLVGLVAGLAAAQGCSSGSPLDKSGTAGTSAQGSAGAGTTGGAGTTSAAGTIGTGAAGTGDAAGTTAAAGTTGTAGTGAAGATGAAGTGAAGTAAAGAGTAGTFAAGTGAAGAPMVDPDLKKVAPTTGCGMAAPAALTTGTLVQQTILTMGTKPAGCADSKCGDWMYTREYYVRLPTGYDKTKAYPLLIEGPGCGGKGNNLYALADLDATVIRVGLSPSADAQAFHATNPNQGCFDDKEGDDSVDWVFYENLWDKLAGQLCFDKNRVFAAGNSSGAWLANELGCKYAGDATHPIRGVMPNNGSLPTDPKYMPTCSKKPLAGLFIWVTGDSTGNPITSIGAINRTMPFNGCPIGTTYQTSMFESFPIGAGNADSTCRKIMGCSELYPLVVCALPLNDHGSHDSVANPGFATFINLLRLP